MYEKCDPFVQTDSGDPQVMDESLRGLELLPPGVNVTGDPLKWGPRVPILP